MSESMPKSRRPQIVTILSALLLLAAASALPVAAEPAGSPGESDNPEADARASMPLDDVLELYRERDTAVAKARELERTPRPPVDAVLDRAELRGRLLDDALEITAKLRLTVLAEGRWVKLPLLRLGPGTQLGELPGNVRGAALTLEDGELIAVAKKAAGDPVSFSFELSWLERATLDGEIRRARITTGPATLRSLRVDVEESLFRLEGGNVQRESEDFRVFPGDRGFDVRWRRLRPKTAKRVVERPPVEPVVTQAHLSTVATLEGEVHHRLRYDLRFEGTRDLTVELPPGLRLERVYVHERSVPFELDGATLRLQLEPARAGDRLGRVELSLRPNRAAYHLSGELLFSLPKASWPINHFYARLHLPSVFDYRWSGGSMAPTDAAPAADFTEALPAPGDELVFHQPLVHGSGPTVRISYDIDLEGQIFAGP
ncbi:MAG: hypothetical protein AAGM22_16355 [Acidobacteriota bacterium]